MTGRQEYDRTKDRQRILGKYMIDDDGFWDFQLVRNPWEVLRNPDLRLNAHYYITKVTESDRKK